MHFSEVKSFNSLWTCFALLLLFNEEILDNLSNNYLNKTLMKLLGHNHEFVKINQRLLIQIFNIYKIVNDIKQTKNRCARL